MATGSGGGRPDKAALAAEVRADLRNLWVAAGIQPLQPGRFTWPQSRTRRGQHEARLDGVRCAPPPSYGFIRAPTATVASSDCARSYVLALNDWLVVPEMDRRSMMLMAGIAAVEAAIPLPKARALPSRPDAPPTESGATAYRAAARCRCRGLHFPGRVRWPAWAGPDPAKWTVQTWQDDVFPPVQGIYRDYRRNVSLNGNSNLVLLATQESPGQYFSGKLRGNWRSLIGQTWESADQARLPDPWRLARVSGWCTRIPCLTANGYNPSWAWRRERGRGEAQPTKIFQKRGDG